MCLRITRFKVSGLRPGQQEEVHEGSNIAEKRPPECQTCFITRPGAFVLNDGVLNSEKLDLRYVEN